MFRLPPGVGCRWKGSYIELYGPQGVIPLKIRTRFVQNSKHICFSRPLTWGEKNRLLKSMRGVCLSYGTSLILQGIGYRAEVVGTDLQLRLGYSHSIDITIPEGVSVKCVKNMILLNSCHWDALNIFTTKLRKLRYPNPYKGTGILYGGEVIILKEGKKA